MCVGVETGMVLLIEVVRTLNSNLRFTVCMAQRLGKVLPLFSPLALVCHQTTVEGRQGSENIHHLGKCQRVQIKGPLFKVCVLILSNSNFTLYFNSSLCLFPLDLPPHMKPMFDPDEAIEWKPPIPKKEFKEGEALTGIAAFITPDLFEKTPPPIREPYILPKIL